MKVEKQASTFKKPSVPTPQTLRRYKIGFTDEFVPVTHFGFVLFFSANHNHNPKFVSQLEKSLEKTLTRFYPLAGRYVEETHTVYCNDQGVEFMHADVNIKLQDLLGDSYMSVNKLVDEFIPSKTTNEFNNPLLAIQVTKFECEGLALGASVSHKIIDASTLCTFLNEWAVMNREENDTKFPNPGFISSTLFPGCGVQPFALQPLSDEMLNKFIFKKLSFSKTEISNLKKKAIAKSKDSNRRWSKVQLVSAIIWKALIDVDREIHSYTRESILFQPINLRGKMASIIPKYSCGNIWAMCSTESRLVETTEELTDLLNDSITKTMDNYSKVDYYGEEGQTMVFNSFLERINVPESCNVVTLSSWCKFPFYEADFGFGNPIWAASGTIPVKNSVCLMDDAGGNGVEAYVFLEVKDVPCFEESLNFNAFAASL